MDEGVAARDGCWVVTDGTVGMEVQCLGLAEALGYRPSLKRIRFRRPWRWLPPPLVLAPLRALDPACDRLEPPWPEVLIGSGRQAVAPSIAIRRASRGATFTVQIQNPTVDPSRFDAVVAPRHDRLHGANVIQTTGALNRLTPPRLAAAAARFQARYAALPRPLVAVLLGGSNRAYRFEAQAAGRLAAQLRALAQDEGAGLLVTPSRRTAPAALAVLRQALAGLPAEIWDGNGENPYLGFLALADALIVTADSVNMVSEAASTGKPVFVVELEGGSRKFRRFHEALRAEGITRPFAGRLESWRYPALRDTERAAAEIRERLEGRPAEAPTAARAAR